MKLGLNVRYFCALFILLTIEAFIAIFASGFIREHFGDVLVVILIYTFIKSFVRNKIKLLWLYIFIFAVLVEVLQYFNFIEFLGLSDYPLARIMFGTTFDLVDIACYFIGCLIIFMFEKIIHNNRRVLN